MNSRSVNTLVAALALAMASSCAFAAEPAPAPAAPAQSVAEILSVQHGLRDRLERHSGEYARFDANAIARMEHAQDNVFAMLRGVDSLDQLSPNQRTELSNSLDEIKAILLANEGDRQICHRERRTGSNLIELRCETIAEREAHARDSKEAMREIAPSAQTRSSN
ncbi:MAG: hypothetical protein ACJ8GK_01900 [Luteimonas sp.]